MKFLDLFAGIGGFRLGLEQAGHECVGFCEIDKFARQSYKAIHNTEGEREYHDITTVSNEDWRTLRGTVELICGGFPDWAFDKATFGHVIPSILKARLVRRTMTQKEWKLYQRITRHQQMSNSQLYKQAGNSVTVPVIYEIARRFK